MSFAMLDLPLRRLAQPLKQLDQAAAIKVDRDLAVRADIATILDLDPRRRIILDVSAHELGKPFLGLF
jgi:hypothetical protein